MAGEVRDLHRGCARAREWVSLRVDGELSELERLLLRRHLVALRRAAARSPTSVATATEIVRTTPHERPSRTLEPAQPRISGSAARARYRLVAAAAAVVAVGAAWERHRHAGWRAGAGAAQRP